MSETENMAPRVGIIMGSQSDWETMKHAADVLERLGVAHETQVVSAHRTPERMFDYARSAAERGVKVIIAGAGGAAPATDRLAQLERRAIRNPYRPIDILADDALDRIHDASLTILEEIGMDFLSEEAREIAKAAGAGERVQAGRSREALGHDAPLSQGHPGVRGAVEQQHC